MSVIEPASLAQRFALGEPSALPEMYRRFSGAMSAVAMALLDDRSLAADAVQQAFVQAWRAATRFDPARDLAPWLYAITRRTAVDVYRRERRGGPRLSLDVDGMDVASADSPSLEQVWRLWQVRRGIAQLHPDEREVLRLAYFDRLTHREIGDRLGVAVGTVKSRTARAHRRLAALLTHLDDSA